MLNTPYFIEVDNGHFGNWWDLVIYPDPQWGIDWDAEDSWGNYDYQTIFEFRVPGGEWTQVTDWQYGLDYDSNDEEASFDTDGSNAPETSVDAEWRCKIVKDNGEESMYSAIRKGGYEKGGENSVPPDDRPDPIPLLEPASISQTSSMESPSMESFVPTGTPMQPGPFLHSQSIDQASINYIPDNVAEYAPAFFDSVERRSDFWGEWRVYVYRNSEWGDIPMEHFENGGLDFQYKYPSDEEWTDIPHSETQDVSVFGDRVRVQLPFDGGSIPGDTSILIRVRLSYRGFKSGWSGARSDGYDYLGDYDEPPSDLPDWTPNEGALFTNHTSNAHSLEQPSYTYDSGVTEIYPNDSTQGHTLDSSGSSYTAPSYSLPPADIGQNHAISGSLIDVIYQLIGNDSYQDNNIESSAISILFDLLSNDTSSSQQIERTSIIFNPVLGVNDVQIGQNIEESGISHSYILNPADVGQRQSVEQTYTNTYNEIYANDLSQSQDLQDSAVSDKYALSVDSLTQQQQTESSEISPRFSLIPENTYQNQLLSGSDVKVGYLLVSGDITQQQPVSGSLVDVSYQLGSSDSLSHNQNISESSVDLIFKLIIEDIGHIQSIEGSDIQHKYGISPSGSENIHELESSGLTRVHYKLDSNEITHLNKLGGTHVIPRGYLAADRIKQSQSLDQPGSTPRYVADSSDLVNIQDILYSSVSVHYQIGSADDISQLFGIDPGILSFIPKLLADSTSSTHDIEPTAISALYSLLSSDVNQSFKVSESAIARIFKLLTDGLRLGQDVEESLLNIIYNLAGNDMSAIQTLMSPDMAIKYAFSADDIGHVQDIDEARLNNILTILRSNSIAHSQGIAPSGVDVLYGFSVDELMSEQSVDRSGISVLYDLDSEELTHDQVLKSGLIPHYVVKPGELGHTSFLSRSLLAIIGAEANAKLRAESLYVISLTENKVYEIRLGEDRLYNIEELSKPLHNMKVKDTEKYNINLSERGYTDG